jgi:hypothetical protein
MLGETGDPANHLEKGVGDIWYVFFHSEAVADESGRAIGFENEADATECLMRCEIAGRIIH